jgi:hypothetical protein
MSENPQPAWLDALNRSYDNPLVFVTEVLGIKPEFWQAEALMNVAQHDRVVVLVHEIALQDTSLSQLSRSAPRHHLA